MHRRLKMSCSIRGVAQPGLARLLGVQEVSGSNPLAPTYQISGRHNYLR